MLLREHGGLSAHGTAIAATPVPYTCRYEIITNETWASVLLEATVEGPGFVRTTRLERATGRWRVTASEQGDLDAALRASGHPRAGMPGSDEPGGLDRALDVDLAFSSLTPTLPIRRTRLLQDEIGAAREVTVAWVLLPSLEVVSATQTYTYLGDGRVRFSSGSLRVELSVDAEGYVAHYPGLADRA